MDSHHECLPQGRLHAKADHPSRAAGLWTADLLGLIGMAAQDYARTHAPRRRPLRLGAKMSHLLHEAREKLGPRH